MLTELNGKGGTLCQPAKEGRLRCPLMIRPTSEDVITGQLFGALRAINPRWWLPDFLNRALGTARFRRQVFRKLRIELWQKQPSIPRSLIPWDEGQTEVDVAITWENPPTTVYVEAKYGSAIATATENNAGDAGFPSDQLIRNVRIGLYHCGWYDEARLFEMPPRDFVQILLAPTLGTRLVEQYRDLDQLRAAIPHGALLSRLPKSPFVGELSYRCAMQLLSLNRKWLTRPEQHLVDQICDYLPLKLHQLRSSNGRRP